MPKTAPGKPAQVKRKGHKSIFFRTPGPKGWEEGTGQNLNLHNAGMLFSLNIKRGGFFVLAPL